MEYSFNIYHAEQYGVDEAIMIKNFQYWLRKNKANNKAQEDDRTWTYNSVKAYTELFPFWTTNQINRVLKSLIAKEVLIVGNYNKMKYDRTLWYSFKHEESFLDMQSTISGKSKMDCDETINAIIESNKTIPDTKEDNNKRYYKNMIAIYDSFCKNRFDAPAKINGMEGKAMKQIIAYLKTLCKMKGDDSPEAIENSFEYIFANWNKIEPFLQKQIKLSQINSNLTNIINQLKNGKEQSNSSNIADEILAKYQ